MPYLKLISFSLLGAAGLLAQSTMNCSSDDMRRHYCSADTRAGVQMIRQRSDAACIEGRTWGYDRRGIWVDRGCRADFAVGVSGWNGSNRSYGNGGYGPYASGPYANGPYNNGGYSGNGGQQFYCASDDMRRHYCSANTAGGVQMLRQRSDAACVMGRTWGYDRQGVWVDRGCRADFAAGTGGYNQGGYNQGGYRNRGYRNPNYRNNDPYYRNRYPY